MRLVLIIPACACLLFLAVGCGKSGVKPEGQILKNGEPFVPPEGDFVQVAFVAVGPGDSEGGSYVAGFNPDDGTFVVSDDNGIPPGKYKVSVQVLRKRKDTLKGAVGPKTSKFVFDIQTGKEEIKVDLAQAGLAPAQKGAPPARGKRRSG
jgi:hypothetical protein